MATKFLNLSTDTTLGGVSPSDELAVSQKAIKTYVDNHGGGGSIAIDNTTITENASQEIQAVATVNANTAAGATNPIYDWVGTLAEYTSQAVATNHPDWVCYITDDTEATAYQAYTQSQCNNLFVQKGHEVIDFQEPNAGNNYTWYRKYADGWIEQGGYRDGSGVQSVTFPMAMANSNYTVVTAIIRPNNSSTSAISALVYNMATTGFVMVKTYGNGGYAGENAMWQVSGMAA